MRERKKHPLPRGRPWHEGAAHTGVPEQTTDPPLGHGPAPARDLAIPPSTADPPPVGSDDPGAPRNAQAPPRETGTKEETDKVIPRSSLLPPNSKAPPGGRPPPTSIWKDLGGLALKIGLIAAATIAVFTFFYGIHRNMEPDMQPMLQDGDIVLYYRLDKDYAIGDLLLVNFQGTRQVRRVVAKGGDVVDVTEAGLVINGAIQQELGIFWKTQQYADGIENKSAEGLTYRYEDYYKELMEECIPEIMNNVNKLKRQ